MGGFLGFGANDKIDTGMSDTKNVFNYGLDTAKQEKTAGDTTTSSGLSAMDSVKDFFKNIMSGSRPAQLAAVAPETNAINAQADAQRTQSANLGTARGGGVAATNANAENTRMKTIDDMLFGARTGAANSEEQVGAQEANVGMEQLSAALKSLGLSDEAIAQYTQGAQGEKNANTQGWLNALKFGSAASGGLAGLAKYAAAGTKSA